MDKKLRLEFGDEKLLETIVNFCVPYIRMN
jgi:hypothetical protein